MEKNASSSLEGISERLTSIESTVSTIHELLASQRIRKEFYSTTEVAKILEKRPYTVREWCRLQRIRAEKCLTGRGPEEAWKISHEELDRIRNEGLLPIPDRY